MSSPSEPNPFLPMSTMPLTPIFADHLNQLGALAMSQGSEVAVAVSQMPPEKAAKFIKGLEGLMSLVERGDVEKIEALNQRTQSLGMFAQALHPERGETLLMAAATSGQLNCVRVLVKQSDSAREGRARSPAKSCASDSGRDRPFLNKHPQHE